MNYITTNIRIPEGDYLRLKTEAAERRKSLAALIREKIKRSRRREVSPEELLRMTIKHAKENAKYLRGIDSVKIFREMRDSAKW